MMNPGWKQPDDLHPLNHSLVGDPDVGLTDFIVKNKIFNFFLYLGCVPLTEEHALMSRMMSDQNTLWKKPVEVRLPHHHLDSSVITITKHHHHAGDGIQQCCPLLRQRVRGGDQLYR